MRRRVGEALTVGALGVGLLAGCDSGAPEPEVLPSPDGCKAIEADPWIGGQPMVSFIWQHGVTIEMVAGKLQTTIYAANHGAYGVVECERGYTPEQLRRRPPVSVTDVPVGLGNLCVGFAISSEAPPHDGVPYNYVAVVCPSTKTG
jgi:hypothetical protein